ncbi:peptidylprolyl isomerase [Oceanicoccus sagamiensis]|uniref:Peptidyl-prolyl cis-trans isomerase n=1 Tax=Oceanicoccus sagamiensis TaxID=716816 RepID=A0A1X9NM84_9GAMM|nr:peptidylprolyl isomerase [Oceanicoccus sagamiensis]ARN75023.1 peptidylprolyl isomerase [Oceanicoccus sagamiensis]
MKKQTLLLLSLIFSGLACMPVFAADKDSTPKNPTAIIHTTKGPITIELYAKEAPITVANFIDYAESGFYNDTIFHRVIKRFMIQGGGFTKEMQRKNPKAPIANESGNGLHNDRWTLAMARTNDPDSATSQFFINTKMNSSLDKKGKTPGYAVFAIVTDGQYVVKSIEKTPTMTLGSYADVPVEPVYIERVEIIK